MADDNSSTNVKTTIQEVADGVVERWESEFRRDPGYYHGVIIESIKQSIHHEVQRAASDVLRQNHSENIAALMVRSLDEWIKCGEIVIEKPSDDVVAKINEELSVLAERPYLAADAARQKKIAVYRLRVAGVKYKDIAAKLGLSTSGARDIFVRAEMDIERCFVILDEYGARKSHFNEGDESSAAITGPSLKPG